MKYFLLLSLFFSTFVFAYIDKNQYSIHFKGAIVEDPCSLQVQNNSIVVLCRKEKNTVLSYADSTVHTNSIARMYISKVDKNLAVLMIEYR